MILEELFTKYGTDKGIWGYTPYYEALMLEQRLEVKKVLEIGICGHRDIPNNVVGASLFCWRDYFPNATIYGVDNDPRFVFNDQQRIITRCADAYNPVQMHEVMEQFGGDFDMVVDDAVHDPIPQVALFNFLIPFLRPEGLYFMEDVCPYKLLDDDLSVMYRDMQGHIGVSAAKTHKPEVMLIAIK
jgi:hypothetical protein